MKEISKIIIKGSSGFGPVEEAYTDIVSITKDSIQYNYSPLVETEINPVRKWSYKTTSPIFQKLFKDISAAVEEILDWEMKEQVMDIGTTAFTVTYTDKTRREREFFRPGDDFDECFSIVKKMVPRCEYIPAVLLTSEDYEE